MLSFSGRAGSCLIGETDAIMRGMDEEVRSREGELDDAFKDLNALMAKAKEMVRPPLSQPSTRAD